MLRFAKFSSLYGLMTAGLMAQGARPMTLVDVMNVPQISDPQVSSNGREILYVQIGPQLESQSSHRSHLESELRWDGRGPDDQRDGRRE